MKRLRVLVVEDDAVDRMALERLVADRQLPYSLDTVTRRKDALQRLAQNTYDGVVVDYSLPDGDGLDVLTAALPTPGILVTGFGTEGVAAQALNRGAYGYLIKDPERNYLLLLPKTLENAIARKEAEDKLRIALETTENRLLQLLTTNPAVLYTRRLDRDHTIAFVAENVRRLTGFDPGLFLDRPGAWIARVHPEDRARVAEEIRRVVAEDHAESEYRFERADGAWIWIHDELNLVRDAHGRGVEIVGYLSDVTARRGVEEALGRSERLASVGTLAAGIAHEVNNPVAAILSAAELGLELPAGADPARLRKLLESIAREAKRCGQIVKQVLQFARGQPSEKRPQSIGDVVQGASARLARRVGPHGGTVTIDVEEGLPRVQVNTPELEQVLLNLVENAAQSRPGVHVEVRVTARGDGVRLVVADDGPGMTEEVRRRIFEPFYSTRGARGTGLGLAIVHGILLDHGAQVAVESEPGGGTTFVIDLPPA